MIIPTLHRPDEETAGKHIYKELKEDYQWSRGYHGKIVAIGKDGVLLSATQLVNLARKKRPPSSDLHHSPRRDPLLAVNRPMLFRRQRIIQTDNQLSANLLVQFA